MKFALGPFLATLLISPLAAATAPPDDGSRRPIADPARRQVVVAPAVLASDGERFFAAWQDDLGDVSGAFLEPNGNPMIPFPVVATWQSDQFPAIVWNGSEYVAMVSAGALGIFPVRISREGDVRGSSAPIDDFPALWPSLAWNGSVYTYAVVEAGESLSLYFLDASLSVRRKVPVAPPSSVQHAQLATDGSRFLLAWTQVTGLHAEIFVQLFDSAGDAAGPPRSIESGAFGQYHQPRYSGELQPAVTWNGSSYFVVWAAEGIKGVLIDAEGTPGNEFQIASGADVNTVSIGWDGFAHLVTWTEVTDIRNPDGTMRRDAAAALVTSTGDWIAAIPVTAGSIWGPGRAAIASNGDVFLVSWGGQRLVIDSTAVPSLQQSEPLTAQSYASQRDPVIAVGTSNVLMAWVEGGRVYAGRVSKAGEPLDGSGLAIATLSSYPTVDVVAGGGVYLVAWRENVSVRGVRISEAGEVLDPIPIEFAQPVSTFVLAAGDDGFRIVAGKWHQEGWAPGKIVLATTSIPKAGAITAELSRIELEAPFNQVPFSLLWNGDRYVLLWTQDLTPPCQSPRCVLRAERRATLLDRHGAVLATRVIGAALPYGAVRTKDGTLVLAYRDATTRLQRLSADGVPLGDPVALPEGIFQIKLAETPDGLVAIHTVNPYIDPQSAGQIRSLSLRSDLTPSGPAIVLIAGDDHPRLSDAASDGRQVWVVYSALWLPRPEAHDTGYTRAFFHLMRPRGRAVGF